MENAQTVVSPLKMIMFTYGNTSRTHTEFHDSLARQLQLTSGNIVKIKTALRFSFSPSLLKVVVFAGRASLWQMNCTGQLQTRCCTAVEFQKFSGIS